MSPSCAPSPFGASLTAAATEADVLTFSPLVSVPAAVVVPGLILLVVVEVAAGVVMVVVVVVVVVVVFRIHRREVLDAPPLAGQT